jgi:lysozyme
MTAERIDFFDLSNWQTRPIDWAAVKAAGVKWVIHKATQGTTSTDMMYRQRRLEAGHHGVQFGAYHFADPSPGNALAEADHFLYAASPRPGDVVPVLDLESNPRGMDTAALSLWVHQWITHVRASLNIPRVILYTRMELEGEFAAKLWVPRYSDNDAAPVAPAPFKAWAMWQFSDGRYGVPNRLEGVPFDVDLSTMAGGPFTRRRLIKALTIPRGRR